MKEYPRSNELIKKHYDDALRIANSFSSKFLLQDDKEGIALLALIRASRTYKEEAFKVKKIKTKRGKFRKIKTKKKVKIKFGTHLMNCVMNALKTSVNRYKTKGPVFQHRRVVKLSEVTPKKKLSRYELRFDDWDPYKLRFNHRANHDYDNPATFFDLLSDNDYGDPLVLKEFVFLIRKRLTDQQNKILDFYFDPASLSDMLIEVDKQRCREILLDENEIDEFVRTRYSNFKNMTYKNMGRALQCSRQNVHQQIITIRDVFKQVRKDQDNDSFKLTKEEQGELYG